MTRRIFWLAANTVRELLGDPVFLGLLFVGALVTLSGRVMADLSVVERLRMVTDVGVGAIMFTGVLVTLFAATSIIEREVRTRMALCILSKPVPRYAWITGKSLGMIAVLALSVAALTVFVFLFIWLETRVWVFSLFTAGFFIFLMLLVTAAYTVMFSTFSTQFTALFYGLLVVIIGHMVDDLRIYWNSHSAAARALTRALYYFLPDLESFSPWAVVVGHAQIPGRMIFYLIMYAISYSIIALTIASLIIDKKEFE